MGLFTSDDRYDFNCVVISYGEFVRMYGGCPSEREGVQLYFDGVAVTVYEWNDSEVILESTFNQNFSELYCLGL